MMQYSGCNIICVDTSESLLHATGCAGSIWHTASLQADSHALAHFSAHCAPSHAALHSALGSWCRQPHSSLLQAAKQRMIHEAIAVTEEAEECARRLVDIMRMMQHTDGEVSAVTSTALSVHVVHHRREASEWLALRVGCTS